MYTHNSQSNEKQVKETSYNMEPELALPFSRMIWIQTEWKSINLLTYIVNLYSY